MEVPTNSPINLTGMDSWNSFSLHILHTTDVTGNGFTGDGWTANTRTRRDWCSLLFSVRTDGTCCYLQESSDNAPVVTPALKVPQGLTCYWTTCMGTLTVQFLLPLSAQELKWEWEICIHCTDLCTDGYLLLQNIHLYTPTHQLISHGSIVGTVSPAT